MENFFRTESSIDPLSFECLSLNRTSTIHYKDIIRGQDQGSTFDINFVIIIFVYVYRMNKLDHDYDVDEDQDNFEPDDTYNHHQ